MRNHVLCLVIWSLAAAGSAPAQICIGCVSRAQQAASEASRISYEQGNQSQAARDARGRANALGIREEEENRQAEAARQQASREFYDPHGKAGQPAPARKLSAKEQAAQEKEVGELRIMLAAYTAAKAGQYEEALKKIGEVIGGDRDLSILKFKARMHLFLGQYDLAVEDYNKLLGIAKEFNSPTGRAGVLILRARALQSAGKFDLAEADLNEALKKGNAYLAHVELVELSLNAGKWQQAVDELNMVMKQFADPARYAKRGLAYVALGDLERAKADLDQAIAGKTKYAPGWLAHASLMAASGQAQAALDDCDYVIRTLDPKDPWAHAVKGNVYMTTLKQPSKAIEEFDAALQISPRLKEVADLRAQAMQSAK
jgi:tetratricopeptide (TPR) repeat protein